MYFTVPSGGTWVVVGSPTVYFRTNSYDGTSASLVGPRVNWQTNGSFYNYILAGGTTMSGTLNDTGASNPNNLYHVNFRLMKIA